MRNAREFRRGGFSFFSFLLGILFGIILLLGALGGVVAFVLYTDLDTVFETANIDNKDEDGNYIFINTNPDDGGVKTVLDLFTVLSGFAGDTDNLTLGDIEKLIPLTTEYVIVLRDSVAEYIDLNLDELRVQKFSQLGDYVQDVVFDLQPASFLSIDDSDGITGTILNALLYGKESEYVEYQNVLYPVWFEEVETTTLAARAGEESNRIYFYNRAESWYIAQKTEDGYIATGEIYTRYNAEKATLTGNYYYNNGNDSGEKVIKTPVTLRDFTSDESLSDILDGLEICELLNMEDGVVYDILSGITIGDVIAGEVDFDEKIQTLEIASIIDIDPESTVMAYLGYGLSGVTEANGANYDYTGIVDGDPVYITAEEGKITGVYSDTALTQKLKGTTVNNIGTRVDGVTVDVFMDIKPDDAIMAYLGYGLTGVKQEGGAYTGKVSINEEEKVCTVETDGEKITRVYYTVNGKPEEVKATGIDQIGDRVNNLTKTLTIGDVLTIDEDDKFMSKLAGYTIANVGDAIDDLTLDDFIEVTLSYEEKRLASDSSILAYIVYGINDIELNEAKTEGTATYHNAETKETSAVTLTVENGKITSVKYSDDGTAINATGVKTVNSRVSGVMSDLKIGQLLNVSGNKILENLQYSTINSLSDDISALTVQQMYTDKVYGTTATLKRVVNADAGENEIEFDAKYLYFTKDSDGKLHLYDANPDDDNPADGKATAYTEGLWTYGAPTSLWKILLYKEDSERAYSVNNIADMINNVTGNVASSTLRELTNAEILDLDDDTLDMELPEDMQAQYGKTLGRCTLSDSIEVLAELINRVNEMSSNLPQS